MANISSKIDVITEIVRKRRRERSISSEQMAKHLGIKQRTYQRWEAGAWTLNELQSILNYLDLKLIIIPKELIE